MCHDISTVSSKPYLWRQKCQLKSFVFVILTAHEDLCVTPPSPLWHSLTSTSHERRSWGWSCGCCRAWYTHTHTALWLLDIDFVWYHIIEVSQMICLFDICKHWFSMALRLAVITCSTQSMQCAGKTLSSQIEVYVIYRDRREYLFV